MEENRKYGIKIVFGDATYYIWKGLFPKEADKLLMELGLPNKTVILRYRDTGLIAAIIHTSRVAYACCLLPTTQG